jgi:hypothetical protein
VQIFLTLFFPSARAGRKMENKMFRLALKGTLVLLFMAYTLHASDFAVKLEDVRKVQDRVYTGTAGKSQLLLRAVSSAHDQAAA